MIQYRARGRILLGLAIRCIGLKVSFNRIWKFYTRLSLAENATNKVPEDGAGGQEYSGNVVQIFSKFLT